MGSMERARQEAALERVGWERAWFWLYCLSIWAVVELYDDKSLLNTLLHTRVLDAMRTRRPARDHLIQCCFLPAEMEGK